MYHIGVFVCALVGAAYAADGGFVQELRGRGLDVGGGLTVQLDAIKAPENASLLEKNALTFNYKGLGVSFNKPVNEDAIGVGFHMVDNLEGRGKKNKFGNFMIPAMLGFKTTTIIVMVFSAIGALVLKSLIVAKMAIVLAAVLTITSLFGGKSKKGAMDLDHNPSEMHPVYAEYPGDISDLGYAPTAGGHYVAYAGSDTQVGGGYSNVYSTIVHENDGFRDTTCGYGLNAIETR